MATCLVLLLATFVAGCETSPVEPGLEGEVEAFVSLMNDHRTSVGCEPLAWNPQVAQVALAHSRDMVERDFFSHTNPDGASPADRLDQDGVEFRRMAENIAWGHPTAEAVLAGWLNSSGHRRNIEDCRLTEHGVGLVESHWTHLFITP